MKVGLYQTMFRCTCLVTVAVMLGLCSSSVEALGPNQIEIDQTGFWSEFAPPATTAETSSVPRTASIVQTFAVSTAITVGQCSYRQESDWPHISANGLDASVHGWWTTTTPSKCPATAKSTAYLQASWCSSFGCQWVTVANGSGLISHPGGGAGRRDNARVRCVSRSVKVAFRGGTDVDLVGVNDPAGITWGPPREGNDALMCAPS